MEYVSNERLKELRPRKKHFPPQLLVILVTILIIIAVILILADKYSNREVVLGNDSTLLEIPTYSGQPYVEINNGIPSFKEEDMSTEPFEYYSQLDSKGRCGPAFANICADIMPTSERGEIGMIKPSGWHTVKYNDLIEGNYLYNRCHLIAFCLAGENANERNLITGTRYLNVLGMLPFEIQVATYIERTGNHVLYRVTPIYEGNNLVANGVQMEAFSVEDNGKGICFNVFCFNVQPGIEIDYKDGESWRTE